MNKEKNIQDDKYYCPVKNVLIRQAKFSMWGYYTNLITPHLCLLFRHENVFCFLLLCTCVKIHIPVIRLYTYHIGQWVFDQNIIIYVRDRPEKVYK